MGRCDHAAVCILGHIGRQAGPLLLIAGGIDNSNQILRDCWIFAIDTAKWMKVEELKSMNYHVHACIMINLAKSIIKKYQNNIFVSLLSID